MPKKKTTKNTPKQAIFVICLLLSTNSYFYCKIMYDSTGYNYKENKIMYDKMNEKRNIFTKCSKKRTVFLISRMPFLIWLLYCKKLFDYYFGGITVATPLRTTTPS